MDLTQIISRVIVLVWDWIENPITYLVLGGIFLRKYFKKSKKGQNSIKDWISAIIILILLVVGIASYIIYYN